NPYTGPWHRITAHPILVINNIYDPATPYQAAQAMTRQLADARPLTVEGYGHTALENPSSCVHEYESRYLIGGILPPERSHLPTRHSAFRQPRVIATRASPYSRSSCGTTLEGPHHDEDDGRRNR